MKIEDLNPGEVRWAKIEHIPMGRHDESWMELDIYGENNNALWHDDYRIDDYDDKIKAKEEWGRLLWECFGLKKVFQGGGRTIYQRPSKENKLELE